MSFLMVPVRTVKSQVHHLQQGNDPLEHLQALSTQVASAIMSVNGSFINFTNSCTPGEALPKQTEIQ